MSYFRWLSPLPFYRWLFRRTDSSPRPPTEAQARRLADRTAFFLNGECVEVGVTEDLFTGEVKDQRTRDYVEGRFG